MRTATFLASLFVLSLGACFAQSDLELKQKVVGTWTGVEIRPGVEVTGFETFRPDGQFLVVTHIKKDGVAPFDVQTFGEWKIDRGMLVTVVTKSDNADLSPVGDVSQDKIIRITGRTLEMESQTGRRLFRERQP